MGVDEVAVLGMILHTRSHAAPHALVHLRIDAIALRAQSGEIHVATRSRILRREDVVPHGSLVEIGIAGIVCLIKEILRKLQHVVGIAALRTVEVADILLRLGCWQEVLAHAVATDADGAVLCHICPEIMGCLLIRGGGDGCTITQFFLVDALETDVLRHLGVGMLAVEERLVEGLHAADHRLMTIFLGCIEILLVAKDAIGICQGFVHAAMLPAQNVLHLGGSELGNHVHGPVAHVLIQGLGFRIAGIEPGITKTCQHLVLAIERHPSAILLEIGEVSLVESGPYLVDRLSAQESLQACGVLVIGLLAILEHLYHIVESLLQCRFQGVVALGRICQGECGEIVSAHMAL